MNYDIADIIDDASSLVYELSSDINRAKVVLAWMLQQLELEQATMHSISGAVDASYEKRLSLIRSLLYELRNDEVSQ